MTDTRTQRLRALAGLIRGEALASQEEVTERLKALGYAVTQATVSRDLEQIGAVKVKRGGVLSYALPEQIGAADWGTGRLERLLREFVVSIEAAGQMLVVRTPPGSAHLVASAIDHAQLPEVAGTVYLNEIEAGEYLRAIDEYGSPAYSPAGLAAAPEEGRRYADLVLANALPLGIETGLPASPDSGRCVRAWRRWFERDDIQPTKHGLDPPRKIGRSLLRRPVA